MSVALTSSIFKICFTTCIANKICCLLLWSVSVTCCSFMSINIIFKIKCLVLIVSGCNLEEEKFNEQIQGSYQQFLPAYNRYQDMDYSQLCDAIWCPSLDELVSTHNFPLELRGRFPKHQRMLGMHIAPRMIPDWSEFLNYCGNHVVLRYRLWPYLSLQWFGSISWPSLLTYYVSDWWKKNSDR